MNFEQARAEYERLRQGYVAAVTRAARSAPRNTCGASRNSWCATSAATTGRSTGRPGTGCATTAAPGSPASRRAWRRAAPPVGAPGDAYTPQPQGQGYGYGQPQYGQPQPAPAPAYGYAPPSSSPAAGGRDPRRRAEAPQPGADRRLRGGNDRRAAPAASSPRCWSPATAWASSTRRAGSARRRPRAASTTGNRPNQPASEFSANTPVYITYVARNVKQGQTISVRLLARRSAAERLR